MSLILLLVGFANILLAFLVLYARKRHLNARLFFIFALVSGYWVLTNYFTGIFPNLILLKNGYAAAVLLSTAAAIWLFYFASNKLNHKITWPLVFIGLIFAYFAQFSNLIVVNAKDITFGGGDATFGVLFPIYGIYILAALFSGLFRLVLEFNRSTGLRRKQIFYVLSGLIIYSTVSTSVSIILPIFKINNLIPLDSVASIFFVSFTAYSITRYRLMDIRLIIFRSISFASLILIITSFFVTVSIFIGSYLEQIIGIRSEIVVGFIVALLVTFIYQPTRKFVEKATNRFLYKERYDPDALLRKISEVTSSILNLSQLLTEISKNLIDAMHCEIIGVALLNKNNNLEVTYIEGIELEKAPALVSDPKVVDILRQELQRTKGILVIDEMKTGYENGEYKPIDVPLLLALYENNIALILPLFAKEKLTGVIAVGNKKSGEPYNQQDLRVLEIIAGQSAVAIENAQLYEEQKQFNVTLQKKVEEATHDLRFANNQLREMDRTKSEFISIASHQLRTPLTVIKGYISMIQEGSFGPVPGQITDQLTKVYTANERLISLVENLLDISRIESGRQDFNWEKVDPADLASTVVEELRKNVEDKGLKIVLHKPKTKLPAVLADRNKLHEVMMNFIDNAEKYTEKGQLDVYISAEKTDKDIINFSVKDTGRGVDKETLPHLFQKFTRGKGSFKVHTEGPGLGLS